MIERYDIYLNPRDYQFRQAAVLAGYWDMGDTSLTPLEVATGRLER